MQTGTQAVCYLDSPCRHWACVLGIESLANVTLATGHLSVFKLDAPTRVGHDCVTMATNPSPWICIHNPVDDRSVRVEIPCDFDTPTKNPKCLGPQKGFRAHSACSGERSKTQNRPRPKTESFFFLGGGGLQAGVIPLLTKGPDRASWSDLGQALNKEASFFFWCVGGEWLIQRSPPSLNEHVFCAGSSRARSRRATCGRTTS